MKTEETYYELALFAGGGGGILGGILRGHVIVGAVEIEAHPRECLLQRQRDGILPEFPIWDDVCTFRIDNPECRNYIETLRTVRDRLIISGGFPCQDISTAGNGKGIQDGTRSGLWFEMLRIIREVRPGYIFIENSPRLTILGGTRVIADITSLGYDSRWGIIGARDAGAFHKRERIWIIANLPNSQQDGRKSHADEQNKSKAKTRGGISHKKGGSQTKIIAGGCKDVRKYGPWDIESGVGRMVDGFSERVDKSIEVLGNAQIPRVVELAWEILGDSDE